MQSNGYLFAPFSMKRMALLAGVSGLLGFLFFSFLYYSEYNQSPIYDGDYLGSILSVFAGIICGYSIHFLFKTLDKFIPWRTFYFLRLLSGFFTGSLLIILISVIFFRLAIPNLDITALKNFTDEGWKLVVLILSSTMIYSISYGWLYSYYQYTHAQVASLQSERKQTELHFEVLKSQLSPHYLFNSLNTISSLLYKDPVAAEEFMRRLAQTFQYILDNQDKRSVSLKEEVDFIRSYFYLLEVRFENNLRVEINLPDNLMQSRIPPLTLQLLVENAVKHNLISAAYPMMIYISAVDNVALRVMNTKTVKENNGTNFKVGIENIKQRYGFFTNKPIIIKDDELFSVQLPVIHTISKTQQLSA